MIKGSDRYSVFLVGLLVAVSLMYLGFPQAVSAFKALDGVAVAKTLGDRDRQDPEELRKLVEVSADALAWGRDPLYARNLSRSYLALAGHADPAARSALLTATLDASVAELKERPLNARAWWRIAIMREAIDRRPSAQSALYLWHSVRVQPNALSLMSLRLRAITDNWFRFSPQQRRDVIPQFAMVWKRDRKAVLGLAQNLRRRGVISAALAFDADLLRAFEESLEEKS